MTYLPERTVCVLIGIEDYVFDSRAKLDGPVADLLRFRTWLIAKGVDPANIAIRAAPLRTNRAELDNADLAVTWFEATRDTVYRALTDDLRVTSSDMLIIYLGGHGFIHGSDRRLLYAEATTQSKLNLNISSLLESLRSSLYAAHPRQLILVDACLTHAQDMNWRDGLTNETFPIGPGFPNCDQRVFFAAGPGKKARNDGQRRAGVFSAALLEILDGPLGDNLVALAPSDLMAALRAKLADLHQEPSYLAYSSNGSEEVVLDRMPGGKDHAKAITRSVRNLLVVSTVLILAAIAGLAIASWPNAVEKPKPVLEVGTFKVAPPTKLMADYTGGSLQYYSGKTSTQIESTAANIFLLNNGSAPALITAVKVEVLFAQQFEDCARGGGGPAEVKADYTIQIPPDLPSLPHTITRDIMYTVQPLADDEWVTVHIGPMEQNLSVAKPYVFAARISLVHDKSDEPLEVGTAAMVATPSMAKFQIENALDRNCVQRMSKVLDELYEIPAERSSELDELRAKFSDIVAPDARKASEKCRTWEGYSPVEKLCARYSKERLALTFTANAGFATENSLLIFHIEDESGERYTIAVRNCTDYRRQRLWVGSVITGGTSSSPPGCSTSGDVQVVFDQAENVVTYSGVPAVRFTPKRLKISVEVKAKSGPDSYVSLVQSSVADPLAVERGNQ